MPKEQQNETKSFFIVFHCQKPGCAFVTSVSFIVDVDHLAFVVDMLLERGYKRFLKSAVSRYLPFMTLLT